jgi:AbrB family looped-hinge helix DNA binding protein
MAKVSSKGQVTIPKWLRTELKINKGDNVLFEIDGGGRLLLRASPLTLRKAPRREGQQKGLAQRCRASRGELGKNEDARVNCALMSWDAMAH